MKIKVAKSQASAHNKIQQKMQAELYNKDDDLESLKDQNEVLKLKCVELETQLGDIQNA